MKMRVKVLLSLVLTLPLLMRADIAMQNTNSKKNTISRETYIVLHTHGSVRNVQTDFVAEVVAENPVKAIKNVMPKHCKSWKLHPDYSNTTHYARIENPASFVSDIIDNYSAQRGTLLRNDKNELCFLVTFVSQKHNLANKVIYQSKEIWASDAESVLKEQLKGRYRTWPISTNGIYNAMANKPFSSDNSGPRVEYIRVSVKYLLKPKKQ